MRWLALHVSGCVVGFPFTRQRSQVRYLSRPPQTPSSEAVATHDATLRSPTAATLW